jgi:RNA polymerase sigma factor (sigma-70 family)
MLVQSSSDVELVRACLAGDRSAFRQIVERYQAMVCAIAYSITGDLSSSEDVAQEAFLVAWKQMQTIRAPEQLRAWLAGIVRNTARSSTRKGHADLLRGAEPIPQNVPTPALPSPLDMAVRREEEQLLWRVLEQIPELYREPLVLYYREHQSVREVSEAMGLSEDTVKQRLARGRQALKEQVAGFVEETLQRSGPSATFTAGVLAGLDQVAGPVVAAGTAGTTLGGLGMGATIGILGGVVGSLVGIAGGIFGTACSIRNARSPGERQLMVKAAWGAWIYSILLVGVFLSVLYWNRPLFESVWFQLPFWSMHCLVLVISIVQVNQRAAQLRATEQAKPK